MGDTQNNKPLIQEISENEYHNIRANETNRFREELERTEAAENKVESEESINNQIKGDKIQTTRNKLRFVDEIKMGLGNEIKIKSRVKKRTMMQRLGTTLKKIFTHF